MREDSIDYNLLTFIDPPSVYPCSGLDISAQIQSKFYEQCMRFLKQQKKLYECSKKIQNRLASSIIDAASLDSHITQQSQKLQKITRQLRKINHHYIQGQQKQQFLSSVCKFINMQQARRIMLQTKITDQNQFIRQLEQIDRLSLQVANLNSDIKLIVQIKQQISSLLLQTVDKLIKGSLSQSLIQKITSNYSQPFLRDPKISNIFITNLTNQRLNYFRLGLNPLINNLNYVQNISELFDKIIQQWLQLLENQLKIFNKENNRTQIKNILKDVMSKLIVQMLPKMERGIYKVKNIVDISKIRACMLELKSKLDLCGDGTWDPLPKLLLKIYIILQQKLEQTAQQLQIAKYNIYSLISYVPIREHLQLIKFSKCYDPTNKQLNWQRGFKRLSDSRDPSKQPNNKSLIIFNLNIWYLYQNVMKEQGQFIDRAQSLIKQCTNNIVNLNLYTIKKQCESKSLQKILDICADIQSLKKTLFSQVNLLGHQKLRLNVQRQIINKFVDQIYIEMLKHHNIENGLKNVQVVQLCKKQKLNLNKYGKHSENLRIFSGEQIKQVLA